MLSGEKALIARPPDAAPARHRLIGRTSVDDAPTSHTSPLRRRSARADVVVAEERGLEQERFPAEPVEALTDVDDQEVERPQDESAGECEAE